MNHTEYDLLYRNIREPDTSSEEEDEDGVEVEQVQNLIKHRKHIFNFVIDSKDRNWVGSATDTFNFQVKFGGDSDTFETYQKNRYNTLTQKYELQTHTEKYLSSKIMSFPINIKNIESISIQSLILPCRLYYLGGANYKHILDFRYLSISIEEISNSYYGTNSNLNKSMALMFPLSIVYKQIDVLPNQIEFKEKGNFVKEFKPAPINSFDNLKFTINDSNGNPLRFKNDILTIDSIDADETNFITITVKEGINEEYRNGDLIKIKNFSYSGTSVDNKFLDFINREEGHVIYMDTSFSNTTISAIQKLVNSFKILVPGNYNSNGEFQKETFASLDSISNITGKILNTNLQFTMFLKVETKVMEFSNLNSQII
jgi:hypothetical protein